MTLVLEPRETVSRRFVWGVTFAALLVALLISAVVISWVGGDPLRAFTHIVESAFGSIGVISDTLVKATPLILTGLACSLAFRMRLWNIGAEGQFLLGAWGASFVVLGLGRSEERRVGKEWRSGGSSGHYVKRDEY